VKHICLFLFFIVISTVATAQRIHFTDTTNIWVVQYINGSDYPADVNNILCRFEKDSIFSGIVYKKMISIGVGITIRGLYREDTVQQKVWARFASNPYSVGDTIEHLIYNSNWQVGDSLSFQFPTHSTKTSYFVVARDSTLINSNWYKVFHFSAISVSGGSATQSFSVIEGVGCLSEPGFATYPYTFENEFNLQCFSNKGVTSPLNPPVSSSPFIFANTDSCNVYLSVNNPTKIDAQLTIFPNPANDEVCISYPSGFTGTLQIIDISGRLIAQFLRLPISGKLIIPIGMYTPGLYFIQFSNNEGVHLTKKLVVR
jgi:hypothetical protein